MTDSFEEKAYALYARFVERREAGEAPDFDELCKAHPGEEAQLRELHAYYEEAARELSRVVTRTLDEGQGQPALAGKPDAWLEPARRVISELVQRHPGIARGLRGVQASESPELVQRLASRGQGYTRYRTEGEIDRGGQGAVLRVFDEDLRRTLAMKVILAQTEGREDADSRTLGRFLEEAQVTGQLEHPGIVPVHELGLDAEGRVYFTMKLVKGESLAAVFEERQKETAEWPLPRVLGLLLRVCEAMAYAHDKRVIHRDLKPANVMVGGFGEVYVMDWGLARILDQPERRPERADSDAASGRKGDPISSDRRAAIGTDSPVLTQEGDVVGTPAYMSPEQASGHLSELDAGTDIYAVGAILYHALAGHMPYVRPGTKATHLSIWQAVRERAPEPLSEIAPHTPVEVVSICEKAMERERANRYGTMLELAEDLRAFLEGRVVRAYETGAWAELRKWVKRNKRLAASLALALLSLVAGVSGMLVVEARGRERVEAEQARTLRLADVKVYRDLVAERDRLWPAGPDTAAGIAEWLRAAEGLDARRPTHEADLAALRAEALPGSDEGSWRFADGETAWQHETLEGLLADIGERPLDIDGMRARLQLAESLEDRSITGAEAVRAWHEARADIAASGAYGDLQLRPQLGLLPLRADPVSGLWEFWHIPSGDRPQLDPESDRWRVLPGTGIVLVLVPGDLYRVGALHTSDEDPFFDDCRGERDQNEHALECELDPFFIAKYELTRAQWTRVEDEDPSACPHPDSVAAGALPVESVSWHDCTRALSRLGLELPTEVQWEAAARAGTDQRFATGHDFASLSGCANLVDERGWDDGVRYTAPVGSFEPNAFGLFDVHGNVWEWTRDLYAPGVVELRPGDGLRPGESTNAVIRGGSWYASLCSARVCERFDWTRTNREYDVGVRAARPVTGP